MEYWKDLIGYEGEYCISSLGRVKTVNRRVPTGNGGYRIVEEKVKVPNTRGMISIKGHPYNVNSLLLQNFPDEYINKFKEENTLEGEVWKPIKGYEDLYEVSNLGRVRSLPTITGNVQQSTSRKGKSMIINVPQVRLGRIINPNNTSIKDSDNGYLKGVVLSREGKQRGFLVHRLVATAFLPNPHNLPEVNHKDRDRSNNRVTNLEWISPEDNKAHAHINKGILIDLYKLSIEEGKTAEDMLRILISNYKKKG